MTATLPPLDELLDYLPDAVCAVDSDGHFVYVSAGFERTFGYPRAQALTLCAFDLVHPDDRAATMEAARQVMAGELQRHFRNRYIHRDGHSIDIQWSARWLPDHGLRVAIGREVTALRRVEEELEHLAAHDALTGLPNRHRLQRELQFAITHAQASGDGLALLYLDLDGFKAINDRSGHDVGDRVLADVAQCLQRGLRRGDIVARVGGDEFVALLPGCRDADTARAVADGINDCLGKVELLGGIPLQVAVSVGIACFPRDGAGPEALIAHADRAMYADKRQRAEAAAAASGALGATAAAANH